MSFRHKTDADLEQAHAQCVGLAKELKGKKSTDARRRAQNNAEQFNEITREIKRRKEATDR